MRQDRGEALSVQLHPAEMMSQRHKVKEESWSNGFTDDSSM